MGWKRRFKEEGEKFKVRENMEGMNSKGEGRINFNG
jgi:hypothetical protein